MVDLYLSGLTLSEVAEEVGCFWVTVRKRLLDRGIAIRDGHRPEINDNAIKRMYIEGLLTTSEIANRLGCSNVTVTKRLRRNGVRLRPSGPFGTILRFRHHGYPVKLGSGWERHVYSILWREFGEDFLFQGEFGEREHKRTPKLTLIRDPGIPRKYRTKKDTYDWHPDFFIPGFGILEVKGGWKVRQKWNQCIVPCIRATEMEHEVHVLNRPPYFTKTWADLHSLLEVI